VNTYLSNINRGQSFLSGINSNLNFQHVTFNTQKAQQFFFVENEQINVDLDKKLTVSKLSQ